MAKIIDIIEQSKTEPQHTNVLWDDGNALHLYKGNKWVPISVDGNAIKTLTSTINKLSEDLKNNIFNSYLHIAYADSADGSIGFTTSDSSNKSYMGQYVDNIEEDSSDYTKYKWSRIKGEPGQQRLEGIQSIDGKDGVDGAPGTSTYFHIKFSDNSDGSNMNDVGGLYIGTYVDTIQEDSENPADYVWKKFQGEDGIPGEQGIPGVNGEDGKTSYLHIAYANSADGTVDFSINDANDKLYIGQYVDFEVGDSYDPTDYKWSRIKGETGDSGIQFYTWLKYADSISSDGLNGTGISDSPINEDGTFKQYIGFSYNQVTPEESEVYGDYKWSLFKGTDGTNGVDGAKGEDGKTTYTWIKYADVIPTAYDQMYEEPTTTTEYIGIATNKLEETESINPNDYKWSKFKGDQGIAGEKGDKGEDGKSYEYIYYVTIDKSVVPDMTGITSENVDGYVPGGWSDEAIGVSEDYRAEWVCSRIKVNNVWSYWKGPILWSNYGDAGKDGGDVQYIYKLTSTDVAPDNPTPADITSDEYQEKGDYINVEYEPVGWDDEPNGVSSSSKYEWVCVRKKINGSWKAYTNPKLWSKYGEDGKDGKDGTSIQIKGTVESIEDLPLYPDDISDCYIIGQDLYVWTDSFWKNVGQFKGDSGIDGVSIVWLGSYASHPQSPVIGNCYYNTTDKKSYIYYDGKWQQMTQDGADGKNGADGVSGKDGSSIIWKGEYNNREEFLSAIGPPQNGYAYKDIADKTSYVFQDEAYYIMNIDGAPGTDGVDGKPIVWKGDLSSPPSNPELNWCYRDTDNGRIYVYDAVSSDGDAGWALMVKDGNDGAAGKDGVNGNNVYITYNDNPLLVTPDTPTGDGTSDGWHTDSTSNVIWMSQKIAASATEGSWGAPIPIKGNDGVDGKEGAAGKQGKTIYPAGKYDVSKTYTSSDSSAPYVAYDDKFYLLIADSWLGNDNEGMSPEDDINAGNSNWQVFEMFEAIFSKIGIIENGLFGSAVFNGDYMFSQYGTLTLDGDTEGDYTNFNPDNPFGEGNTFYPNTCFNFLTGEVWLNKGNIHVNEKGGSIGNIDKPLISWNNHSILLGHTEGGIKVNSSGKLIQNTLFSGFSIFNSRDDVNNITCGFRSFGNMNYDLIINNNTIDCNLGALFTKGDSYADIGLLKFSLIYAPDDTTSLECRVCDLNLIILDDDDDKEYEGAIYMQSRNIFSGEYYPIKFTPGLNKYVIYYYNNGFHIYRTFSSLTTL